MSDNWKKMVGFLGLMTVLAATACVNAEERAATSSLPAALTSMGISAEDVVSSADAHQVRGQGGISHANIDWLKCYYGRGKYGGYGHYVKCGDRGGYKGGKGGHDGGKGGSGKGGHKGGYGGGGHGGKGGVGNGHALTQTKDFSITDGTASGTVNIMEGFIGTIAYKQVRDGQTLVVTGTFGGLEGRISATDKGLQFQFAGKAIQETFDFTGTYNQHFSQSYMSGK